MLEAGSSKDPTANASVTTQHNRQSPSPSIHATLFSTGHPPGRRGSRSPSHIRTVGQRPHPSCHRAISADLGFEIATPMPQRRRHLKPEGSHRGTAILTGLAQVVAGFLSDWRSTPAGQTSQFNQRIRVAMSRISIARRTAALFRSTDLEHPPQVGFPVKPTLPTTQRCLVNA